jgi:hypothetical protein
VLGATTVALDWSEIVAASLEGAEKSTVNESEVEGSSASDTTTFAVPA